MGIRWSAMMGNKIYFQGTAKDEDYLYRLKAIKPANVDIRLNLSTPSILTEVKMKAQQLGTNQIAVTNHTVLKMLLEKDKCSLDDYAGSIIDKMGCEWLILNPLEHLVTVPYGKFLAQRYLSKFWAEEKWLPVPEFTWNLFSPEHIEFWLGAAENALFITIDIETLRDDPDRVMTCVGFTIVEINLDGKLELTTVTVPLYPDGQTGEHDLEFNLAFIRAMCDTTPGKVLQNGKYDIAYLLRWNCPIRNYAGDTKTLFNSWYSELPKRLDFITAFCVRKVQFWKDENVGIGLQHYKYNARDCFNTALSWIGMLLEVPEYAVDNFKHKFPLLYPSILTEHTGIKIDPVAKDAIAKQLRSEQDAARQSLRTMVGCKSYNPGSWQQTLRVWEILGCADVKSTDDAHRNTVADRHPLNAIITQQIKIYREASKAAGSYADKDFTWLGRCYYALDPDATDTARNSSQESAFWIGLNIQNIPVAEEGELNIKDMFIADDGFELGECDYAQNETWYQAYTSGDPALCAAIEDRSRDFHAHNAEKFFGVVYDTVVRTTKDEATGTYHHKTIDKPLRNLSKRPNHGAAYNMTAPVLLDTMGIKKVREAKALLKLPYAWTPKQVCQHLLNTFDKTYPVVRGENYERIKSLVESSGILVGPTGWTRRCFSNPTKDKRAMNMYAAHNSQSPAAIVLDKCYLKVFNEVWRNWPRDFKLGPQIHDSIFFQNRKGYSWLGERVARAMDYSLPVKDIFGKVRILRVPTDLKMGGYRWSDL